MPLKACIEHTPASQESANIIRFRQYPVQCSNLDLHLETDNTDQHLVKVVDSVRKAIVREIPFSDLQYLLQPALCAWNLHQTTCKCIYGIEVAEHKCSALEVL